MSFLTGSITIDILLGVVTLLGLIYWFLKVNNEYWKNRGVPYLEPCLLFGNLKDNLFKKRCLHDIQREIYWKLDGERFGGYFEYITPTMMIRDPETIERVLVKDFSHFVDRQFDYTDPENEPLSAAVSNLSGNQWRHMRHKLSPTFTSGKLKGMFEQMSNCGGELIELIRESSKKHEIIEAKCLLDIFTTDVIASCAFGLQIKPGSDGWNTFRKAIDSNFSLSVIQVIKFFIGSYNRKLGKLLRIVSVPKDVNEYILSITKAAIDYREKNSIVRNDFLQLLLTLREQERKGKAIDINEDWSEEDAYLKQIDYKNINDEDKLELTDGVVAGQAFVFLTAGAETTSNSMAFTLYSLATNPQIQQKAQASIDEVLQRNGGKWSYQVVKEMTYLDEVIQESLRLHPFIFFLLRMCTSPYKMPGSDVTLEKGERLTIPVYSIHMDPRYYPDPEQFKPERFRNNNLRTSSTYLPFGDGPRMCIGEITNCALDPRYYPDPEQFKPERFRDNNLRTSSTYLPFGDGPRMCIGMRFAFLEMKVCLARILTQFSVSLNPKTEHPLKFDHRSFIPKPKDGIWVDFHPRA